MKSLRVRAHVIAPNRVVVALAQAVPQTAATDLLGANELFQFVTEYSE